jgi:integrase
MKLTDQVVKEAEVPEKGRAHIWDDDLTGFGLRVYPSGSRSFVYRYTSPTTRRRRLMALGEWPTTTLHKARKRAQKARGKVLDEVDPQGEKDEAREKARTSVTFNEFVPIYLRRMKDRWAERTAQDYRSRIERNLLPALGRMQLEEITRAQVSNLMDRIGQERGPYESNRAHAILRAALNKADEWGFLPEGHPNPALRVKRFKEQSRDRWLRPHEVERLMEAVRGEEDPYFRAFVALAFLTGCRKSELLTATWDAVDFDRGELRLPRTKSGRPQVRRLSGPAREVLRFLPRMEGNPYIFPGRKKGSHITDFKKPWDRVREAAGLEDIRFHDVRRTAGSYMAQAGVPLQVIGEVLGHQHPAITKVYARLASENEREAVEALGDTLGGLLGLEEEVGT